MRSRVRMPDGPPAEVDFAALLALEEIGDGRFRGWCHQGAPMRAFGGHLAAQAFAAAARTVPPHQTPASMHAYFAEVGSTEEPVEYVVSSTRDGGTFSTRSVTAAQRGRTALVLLASFQRPEEGPRRQLKPGEAVVPPAGDAGSGQPARGSFTERAIEQHALPVPESGGDPGAGSYRRWMRARLPVGDDRGLQAGAVIYMADMVLARAALQPHASQSQGAGRATSLDHAVWFHGPVRADEWLLLEAVSPVLAGSRGLSFAHVYDQSGEMVASAAQDVLARQLGG
jgi:acyl-CoA thioesterase-2